MGESLGRRSDVTVRFHLDTLVGTGRVERVTADRKGPGRPALMLRATQMQGALETWAACVVQLIRQAGAT